MSKKIIDTNAINKFINILSTTTLFPKESITTEEVNKLWDRCEVEVGPESELANWDYTLDEDNDIIVLNTFTNTTATEADIYARYKKGNKTYDTKISSWTTYDKKYLFQGNAKITKVNFKQGFLRLTFTQYNDTTDNSIQWNMFNGCTNLKEINGLENLDFSNSCALGSAFRNCSSLEKLDLSILNNVNIMNDMGFAFCDCTNLKTLILPKFTNLGNCRGMFRNCSSLTSLDLSYCSTAENSTLEYLFSGCSSLTSLDLTSFNTSNVTDGYGIFYNCTSLKEIKGLENLDFSKVDNPGRMFYNCSSLTSLDLTSFDTSNSNYLQEMFMGCTNLKEIKVSRSKWVIKSGCTTTDMFKNCGCSKVTYVD